MRTSISGTTHAPTDKGEPWMTDADRARTVGSNVFHPHTLRLTQNGGGFGMRLSAALHGPVVVGRLQYRTPVEISAREFGTSYHVNSPLTGGIRATYGFDRDYVGSSSAIVQGPLRPTSLEGCRQPLNVLGVKLDRAELEGALAGFLGTSVNRPIEFTGRLDLHSPEGRLWTTLVRRLDDLSGVSGIDEARSSLIDSLLLTLLRAAPNDHSDQIIAAAAAPSRRLAIATSLMHANADRRAPIPEIALHADFGVRALEKQAHKSWGTTVSRAYSRLRLAYARADLVRNGASQTIAQIATRWGFMHAGRFSTAYDEAFGELPSRTASRS